MPAEKSESDRSNLLARIDELESLVKDLEWALEQNEERNRQLVSREGSRPGPGPRPSVEMDSDVRPELNGLTHILVVDRDPEIRALLVGMLSHTGSVTSEAASGIEAIHMVSKNPFDIAIVELGPDGRIGLELLRQMREIDAGLCVIMATENATVETAVLAMRQGAYDYLTKPFDMDHLQASVARAVERRVLMREARAKEAFRQLSITDGLTGVSNHRHFCEVLEQEVVRAGRFERPLSMLMIDIDDFKLYNDTNGHQAGDRALADMARVFCQSVRRIDLVARYGGEEFAVLLPETDNEGARTIGSHIRNRAAQQHFEQEQDQPRGVLTVSVGIATLPAHADTRDTLIKRADEALYAAKAAGKNRVFTWQDGRIVAIR